MDNLSSLAWGRMGHPTDRINFQTNIPRHGTTAVARCWHVRNNDMSDSRLPLRSFSYTKYNSSLLTSWVGFAFASSRYSAPPASLRHHSAPAQPLLIQSWRYFFYRQTGRWWQYCIQWQWVRSFQDFASQALFWGKLSFNNQKLSLYRLGLPQE